MKLRKKRVSKRINATEVFLVDWVQRVVLMGLRKPRPGKPFHYKRMGGGGKCEEGESPLTNARREVGEELGVTLHDLQNIGTMETFRTRELKGWYMVHLYVCSSWSNVPRPSNEMEPTFVSLDEPYPDNLANGVEIILRALARDEKDFLRITVADQSDGSTHVSHYLEP